MIVKVQMPIATNASFKPALVYAKGRIGLQQQILTEETLRALNGDLKGFFEARHDGKQWIIGKRVDAKGW